MINKDAQNVIKKYDILKIKAKKFILGLNNEFN